MRKVFAYISKNKQLEKILYKNYHFVYSGVQQKKTIVYFLVECSKIAILIYLMFNAK